MDNFHCVRTLFETEAYFVLLCRLRNRQVLEHPAALADRDLAVKVFTDSRSRHVRRELHAMRTLDHPNIATSLLIFRDGRRQYVVAEYCALGSLASALAAHKTIPKSAAIEFVGLPIARALAYMHCIGFVHNDVRPEHILMHHLAGARLTGFSQCVDPTVDDCTMCSSPNPFAAPECRDRKQGDVPQPCEDVYALARCVSFAVSGSRFAKHEDPLLAHVIDACSDLRPCSRPTSTELVWAFKILVRRDDVLK